MNDEELLRQLSTAAKEVDDDAPAIDPRLDALCAGTLDEEQEEALRRELDGDEDGALELFTPLDETFKADLALRLAATDLREEPEGGSDSTPGDTSGSPAPPLSLEHARARRRLWMTLGTAVAAAAAVSLFLLVPNAPPSLPGYALTIRGGDQSVRGASAEQELTFSTGSLIDIRLRPQRAVGEELRITAAATRGPQILPLELDSQIAPGGAARIRGIVGENVNLDPGEWKLIIVVSRPGAIEIPEAAKALVGHGETHEASYSAFSRQITITDD